AVWCLALRTTVADSPGARLRLSKENPTWRAPRGGPRKFIRRPAQRHLGIGHLRASGAIVTASPLFDPMKSGGRIPPRLLMKGANDHEPSTFLLGRSGNSDGIACRLRRVQQRR